MCGIIWAKSLKDRPINELIATAYQAQKGRGLDGFGFTEAYDGKIITNRFVKEIDFLKRLEKSDSREILLHHRAPTSTDNNVKTNHPIVSVGCYENNYYFIHNGVIRNDSELKDEHEKKYNSIYTTDEGAKFNDSEALMHELILIIEGKKEPKDFDVKGGLAFIMWQYNKFNLPIAMYYGRNSNPLTKTETDDHIILASTGGKIDIDINRLFRFDYKTGETTIQEVSMGGTREYRQLPLARIPEISHTRDTTKQTVIELPSGDTDRLEYTRRTWTGEKKQSESYRQIGINCIMNFCRVSEFSLRQLTNQELSMLLYMGRNILNNQHMELERAVIINNSDLALTIDAQIIILNDNLDIITRLLDK